MITQDVRDYAQSSVLCWLATCSETGQPTVSPKELFLVSDDRHLVIANIASPNSVRNIRCNPRVCVSFVDVFVQRGYKLVGTATVYEETHPQFDDKSADLRTMAGDAFPISGVIEVAVSQIQPIIAPSYLLYPQTTEAEQIEQALKTYGVTRR